MPTASSTAAVSTAALAVCVRSAENGTARMSRAAAARITRARGLVDELIGPPGKHDLAGLFERTDDLDDLVASLFHVGETHRSEQVDLLGQVAGGPLGEVAHDLLAHLGTGALQGDGEVLGVDLAQHELHGAVVEPDDVFEHEH